MRGGFSLNGEQNNEKQVAALEARRHVYGDKYAVADHLLQETHRSGLEVGLLLCFPLF